MVEGISAARIASSPLAVLNVPATAHPIEVDSFHSVGSFGHSDCPSHFPSEFPRNSICRHNPGASNVPWLIDA